MRKKMAVCPACSRQTAILFICVVVLRRLFQHECNNDHAIFSLFQCRESKFFQFFEHTMFESFIFCVVFNQINV